jgi:TP901 family phage tail tape measure protein
VDVFNLFAKISLDTSEYERGLEGASERTSGFGGKLKSALGTLGKMSGMALAGATTAVVGFGKASVETGMNFDSAMSQVAATMGVTTQSIGNLRDFAMDMGSKTAFSATEAAEALNFMALAGYDGEQAMSALPNVLNLAAAGNIDLAAASDMVTDAQSALGLTMEQSSVLVDQMARASSKSNTSVAQLGDAILTVGGTAKNLAGGTTELNAVLGVLADNGVKGAEGGTALRNVILSLGAPTDKAAKALNAMNVEVYDAQGNMRPLPEIFGDLNGQLSTMTQGERTQVLNDIFNKVDLKSVNALMGTNVERWEELTTEIGNSRGAAEKMAATQLDNLAGDITLFKSAMEGAQIVISDGLTPTLRGFVQFGSTGISTLSDAFREGGLSGAMEALGTILSDGLNMVISKVPDMIDAGMKLLGALGTGLMNNSGQIIDAAVKVVTMLVNGLATGAPQLAQGAVQMISQLVSGIGKALPQLIPAAVDAIWKFIEGLTSPSAISGLLNAAVDLIGGLVQGIGNALPKVTEAMPQVIANIIEGLIAGIPQLLEIGVQLLAGLGQGLINGLAAIPQIIGAVVEGIINGFKSLFGIHSPSTVFAEMGGMLIQGLLQGLQNAWEGITSFFSKGLEWITTTLSDAWDGIKETASQAWDGITTFLGDTWEGIKTTAWDIFDNVKTGIGNAWEGVKKTTSNVWEGLTGWLGDTWDKLTGKSDESFGATSRTIQEKWLDTDLTTRMTWDELQKYTTDVWQAMQKGSEEKFKSIYNSVHKNWEAADEDTKKTWKGLEIALEGAWAGLEATSDIRFTAMKDNVENAWKEANTSTDTEWGHLVTTVSDGALAALTAVGNNFGKMEGTVVSNLSTARSAARGVDFSSVGAGIVDGMSAGVRARAQALAGSVVSAASMALNAAKAAMGIHSPSTVFRDIIGVNIGKGMAVGVDESKSTVVNSILSITDSIQKAFNPTFAMDFPSVNVPMDFAPARFSYNASAYGSALDRAASPVKAAGDTTVNIYSPVAVDPIQAAREWKKTTQRLAMGF